MEAKEQLGLRATAEDRTVEVEARAERPAQLEVVVAEVKTATTALVNLAATAALVVLPALAVEAVTVAITTCRAITADLVALVESVALVPEVEEADKVAMEALGEAKLDRRDLGGRAVTVETAVSAVEEAPVESVVLAALVYKPRLAVMVGAVDLGRPAAVAWSALLSRPHLKRID